MRGQTNTESGSEGIATMGSGKGQRVKTALQIAVLISMSCWGLFPTGTVYSGINEWARIDPSNTFIRALVNDPTNSNILYAGPTSGGTASISKSLAEKPLEVLFIDGLLSVTAQNATLKALSDAIAQKTGIDIALSPTLKAVVVSVQFANVDVETGLKEILRVAGVASYAWKYSRGHQPREMGKWVLSRMDIVAEGPDTGQPPASTATPSVPTANPQAPPSRISGKSAPNRESYFDAQSQQFVEMAAREVLVRFRKELSDDEIAQIIQNLGAQVISQHEKLRFYRLRISETESVSSFIRKNQAHPDLPVIEPNYLASSIATGLVPNDPLFQNQWALERIKAADAWAVTPGRQDVVIAVIDTGIDPNHPDLQGKVLPGQTSSSKMKTPQTTTAMVPPSLESLRPQRTTTPGWLEFAGSAA